MYGIYNGFNQSQKIKVTSTRNVCYEQNTIITKTISFFYISKNMMVMLSLKKYNNNL